MEKVLVYGIIADGLVFTYKTEAENLAKKWFAIRNAKTWADFIEMTSEETFDDLMLEILEVLGYQDLYPQYLMGEDLSNYITDLVLPQPEDEFSTDLLPGFEAGEHMPVLSQEMMSWIPETLQDEIGVIERHDELDFRFYINPENEELVVASFRIIGFEVEKNQELIEKASGLL